jgi:predicted anti-sigma-YlaC factor YlaD
MKTLFRVRGTPTATPRPDSLNHPCAASFLVLIALILSGCSIKTIAVEAVADAIAESSTTYAADNDIDFVGQASPFGLKTTEGLLEAVPEHRGLLLAAARGFTQYAYVYIEQPANEIEEIDVQRAYAERGRARQMYLRAKDYGLRGLETTHPGIASAIGGDPEVALAKTTADDVALLYWTAAAWASAISLAKDDPDLFADLHVVEALITRAYELDESYDYGAIHVFLISYEMSQSGLREDAVIRARQHFDRALELSDGMQAAPYVAFAEAVTIAEQDREAYHRLLDQALGIDANTIPEWRLANLVMQRRARWLLAHTDELFLE